MSNYMEEAFAPAESRYKEKVTQATFGHLAPMRNRNYRGHIIYAVGCFGSDPLNPTVLECKFRGLDSSPWFFDSMNDFISDDKRRGKPGNAYRFDGIFRNYEFHGTVRRLRFSAEGRQP